MSDVIPARSGFSSTDNSKLSIKERFQLMSFYSLCMLANTIGSTWLFLAILGGSRQRAWRLTLAYDQVANAAFGGSEDETISSRAGKARDGNKKWGCVLCKVLDFIEKNHCTLAKETFIRDLKVQPLDFNWIGAFQASALEAGGVDWSTYSDGSIFRIIGTEPGAGMYVVQEGKPVPVRIVAGL